MNTMANLTEAEMADAVRFASGRVSAVRQLRGDTFSEAIATGLRWFPRVSRQNVKPTDPSGFKTRAEAIDDARKFRELCRAALRKADAL